MHIIKKLSLVLLFCFIFSETLFAGIYISSTDTSAGARSDTCKTRTRRLINREFSTIFLQNLRTSFAGNEFFDRHPTRLVADLAPNFVLINTPKQDEYNIFFNDSYAYVTIGFAAGISFGMHPK
ncbi:MAG TPA: hypothetical protein VIM16_05460 [Mucilaginibacter sp.]|jgi:hypothetical protein